MQELDKKYNIIIITNQKRLKKYELRDDFIEKIDAIVKALDIPINIYISTGEGYYRKPFTGLWANFIKSRPEEIVLLRGRIKAGGFYLTDWMFAHNLKIKFMTPENIFYEIKRK